MSYVQKILLPGEEVVMTAREHWIIYLRSLLLFVLATTAFVVYRKFFPDAWPARLLVRVLFGIALVAFLRAWFGRWIREFAVTNLRVIYAKGFIWRHSVEMNIDQVESVHVDQSIPGRIFGYGTLHVLGTGQGIEHLHDIDSPLELRSAIIGNEHQSAKRLHLSGVAA
jgi:uncharacterized membrane protein YdbT with pleckstrin-like domain